MPMPLTYSPATVLVQCHRMPLITARSAQTLAEAQRACEEAGCGGGGVHGGAASLEELRGLLLQQHLASHGGSGGSGGQVSVIIITITSTLSCLHAVAVAIMDSMTLY